MHRRNFFTAVAAAIASLVASTVGAGTRTGLGLAPTGSPRWWLFDHKEPMLLTANCRMIEATALDASPGDPDFDNSELGAALEILRKYQCSGVVLPDEIVKALGKKRRYYLGESGIEIYARSKVKIAD